MAKLQVLTKSGLGIYDELIKQYIADADAAVDAKSLKTVAIEGNKLYFYREEDPVEDGTTPAFTIELPETDLTDILSRLSTLETNKADKADTYTKDEVDAAIKVTDDKAVANAEAIDAINDEEKGILAQAKAHAEEFATAAANGKDEAIAEAKQAADDAQDAVDALAEKVGEVTEGKTVVEMIADAQTAATYNDEEVRGLISANTQAITNEATTAREAEKANADAIAAVDAKVGEVAEGKTLAGLVAENTQAINTLNGEGEGSVKKAVDDAINKFATDVTDDAVVNSYKELIDWVAEHGSEAAEMAEAIQTNATDIAELEKLVGALPEGATATTVVELIQALVNAEKSRAEGVEGGLDTRLQKVEAAIGENGSVDTQIDAKIAELDANVDSTGSTLVSVHVDEVDGKVTAVTVTENLANTFDAKGAAAAAQTAAEATAAADATEKANTAEENAKAHATALDEAMDLRVESLEGLVGSGYEAITEDEIRVLFS